MSVAFEGKHFLFLHDSVCQVVFLHSVVYCALFIFVCCFVFAPCCNAIETGVNFKTLDSVFIVNLLKSHKVVGARNCCCVRKFTERLAKAPSLAFLGGRASNVVCLLKHSFLVLL